jgi:hypothetical protein
VGLNVGKFAKVDDLSLILAKVVEKSINDNWFFVTSYLYVVTLDVKN